MLADPDLPIPGVTTVEPGLQAYDAQPWRLHGPSPAQGFAGTAIAGAVAGGPAGLVALGGLAAVAAAEYLSAGQETSGASIKPELVGELRGYVAQALERQAEAAAHPTDQTRS